ncbi:hypothetical protein BAUCODRAFT_71344 [Baudoinia panamericana UAMH 10762]|uniref:Uncharacterized protein n=1 Tax=Baudoinia panamericana (strain UAMH 10762) TaxID=717646 RepID=M2N967_BAUPA|nr:uncharacterized protein BAUCODRAFT_71344 [Baudoinia panamericana UAMH 10762]EMC95634.1 hypothetical protein BAUCODRAFT_71344 [Baudoinia panamericana UAMH 10762]
MAANIIPLVILLLVVAIGGFIAYQVYVWTNEMKDRASKHMEKKNLSFTKDGGLKVGVKQVDDESYTDKTQNVLVNVWNQAELPNYKSRLGWNSTQAGSKKPAATGSNLSVPTSVSRSSSQSSRTGRPDEARSSSASLAPPEPRGSQRRSASPVPGGWE